MDCTFYDRGTSSNHATWTESDFTDAKISRDNDCTTLIPGDTWDVQMESISNNDLCIEFDVNITYTGNPYFLRYYGSNQPVANVSVSFDVVSNGSVVEHIDSATTNSNGVCSVSYQSENTGSIYIQCNNENIISNNFICFLGAREGEVNDFTKEGRNCPLTGQ